MFQDKEKLKRLILRIAGVLVVGSIGLGLWRWTQSQLHLWNSNSITVTTNSSLSLGDVKVEFGISVNTIGRLTDADLFDHREKYTVLFDGKYKEPIVNEYGENDFLITYDNKLYFSFRHFKTNRRHQHDYSIHLFQRDGKTFVRVDIRGDNAMKFERPLLDIDLAESYRCNVPVDSAGIIYNMIELVDPGQ